MVTPTELFKLFGKIAVENDEANEHIDETTDKAEKSESKIAGAFGKIGAAAVNVSKVVGAGMIATAGAVAGFTKSAVSNYADYEQLTGGVETLFKDSADKVMEYSKQAFQTTGLSANEYMETVTSFSASMIASLGGDTEKAAEKSNQAIVDMSDNANKMGSSMESIQNAYSGFAKQNYTMLDNLKLGYGGTQAEMERLLADAEKISGFKYDISSYADIVDAIHVVQTEMDITGTTQKEAATTISGSIGMMKGSWTDFITGMSDSSQNFDMLVTNLVNSIGTVGDNVIPRIIETVPRLVSGLTELVNRLAPKIPPLIEQLLPTFIAGGQQILQGIVAILPSLIDILVQNLPLFINGIVQIVTGIANALPQIIQTLVNALPTIIPMLIQGFVQVFNALVQNLPQIIQILVESLPDIIMTILDSLQENLPILIDGIIQTLMILIENLPDILIPIIEALPEIITTIVTVLLDNLPILIEGCVQLIMALVESMPEITLALINSIPVILANVGQAIINAFPQLLSALGSVVSGITTIFKNVFDTVVGTIKLIFAPVVDFFKDIWNKIKQVFEPVVQWFKDVFEKVSNAIHTVVDPWIEIFSRIWTKIKEAFTPAIDWFKDTFNKVTTAVKKAFEPVGNFFKDVWSGIKQTFGSVADWFKNIFTKAWQGVKDVFSTGGKIFDGITEGIVTFFKTIVNGIITGINKVISVPFKAINGILKTIKNVEIVGVKPFDWVDTFTIPSIPKLETGAVLEKGQVGLLEGNGAEAVVPLEKNEKWINAVAEDMNNAIGNQGMMDKLDELIDSIKTLKIYLNNDILVGQLAPAMDGVLGDIYDAKGRGDRTTW